MKAKIIINYHWWCDAEIETPEQHKKVLKEDAEDFIFQVIKEGYNQGELCTSVRFGKDVVPEEDEENGLTYSGWWSIQRELIN